MASNLHLQDVHYWPSLLLTHNSSCTCFEWSSAIIFCAGNENEFIPNAALIFKWCQKSCGYHDDMKFCHLERDPVQINSNFSNSSVLVIDNVAYLNLQPNAPWSFSSWKNVREMQVLRQANL
jgi:hypothetical protein